MSASGQAIRRQPPRALGSRLPWRRMLRWSLSLALLAAIVAAGLQAVSAVRDSTRFPVRRVAVDGPLAQTDRARLEAIVTQFSGRGFYQADLDGLRRSLQLLPWVRQVAIRKVLPDQLRIHVLEHQPAALWNAEQLLSTELVRFAPGTEVAARVATTAQLPQLWGPEAQAELVWASYQRWRDLLAEHGLGLTQLRRDSRGSWRLRLAAGPELLLGREAMDRRLARWLRVQQGGHALALTAVERIDLRYTNGFAVAWKPAQPAQQG